jgi:hypothetical protein
MSSSLQAQSQLLQKASAKTEEKGIALAPSQKDRTPWYFSAPKLLPDANANAELGDQDNTIDNPDESNRDRDRRLAKGKKEVGGIDVNDEEFMKENERRVKDMNHKKFNDPLREVEMLLKEKEMRKAAEEDRMRRRRMGSSFSSRPNGKNPNSNSNGNTNDPTNPELTNRLNRELSERARALELIARKKREREAAMGLGTESVLSTPVSMRGGGYGDVFNKRETEDATFARRKGRYVNERERERDRRW